MIRKDWSVSLALLPPPLPPLYQSELTFDSPAQCLRLLRVWLVFADVDTRVGTREAALVHPFSERFVCLVGVHLSEELLGHPSHIGLGGGRAEMQTVPIRRISNTFSYIT